MKLAAPMDWAWTVPVTDWALHVLEWIQRMNACGTVWKFHLIEEMVEMKEGNSMNVSFLFTWRNAALLIHCVLVSLVRCNHFILQLSRISQLSPSYTIFWKTREEVFCYPFLALGEQHWISTCCNICYLKCLLKHKNTEYGFYRYAYFSFCF